MFALDHYHYARRFSVHLFDMIALEETNDYVYQEFEENGNFVVVCTFNRFSSMGIMVAMTPGVLSNMSIPKQKV